MAYASRLYPRAKPRGFTLQWIISVNSGRIQFRPYPNQKSKIKNQKSKIKNQKMLLRLFPMSIQHRPQSACLSQSTVLAQQNHDATD